MNLVSLDFMFFLTAAAILFYVFQGMQKYILLFASLFFYISISAASKPKLVMLICYVVFVTYVGAVLIEKSHGKMRRLVLALAIAALAAVLVALKYAYNLCSLFLELFRVGGDIGWLQFAPVIGLSYFVLSAIGYLIEVSWESYRAERNIFTVALFIYYFPQVISGPVTRFQEMKSQFDKRMPLRYENIMYGIRRMLWGYFKKLVISERFGMIVSTVYSSYGDYSAIGIIGATLAYAVQLYTDFSGCMDIVLGVSELFGIRLPENFNAPFFSRSVQEFWQRWHITLGLWFKDYVMYPVQISKPMVKLGKKCKKKFGKKTGKKMPFYLSMLVLWFLIGVWHGGTGYYFIASAVIPCFILIASDLAQPLLTKWQGAGRTGKECFSRRLFQSVRTLLLICICWVFVCSNGTMAALSVFRHMVETPVAYTPLASAFEAFGLTVSDLLVMVLGVVVLIIADFLQYNGSSVTEKLDEQNGWFCCLVIYLEVFAILLYGMVGTSSFIYFQF